ncbi:MAG: DUF2206 domain-containing protein [Methanothrix sp.]
MRRILLNIIKRCNNTLALTVAMVILTDLAIWLDIPFLRQILGFIYLTILPGALLLGMLRLNRSIPVLDKLILVTGLSFSYIIFSGLLINYIYPRLVFNRPFSINSLVITMSLSLVALATISYLKDGSKPFELSIPKLDAREKALLIPPIIFTSLSILGSHMMNAKADNSLLMMLFLSVSAYVILLSYVHDSVRERVYPAVIFLISISIVLVLALRSNHLIGVDIHNEYYIFLRTIDSGIWQQTHSGDSVFRLLDACLSVSILPAVYQSILNIDPELLFKILYPVIFSISPLIVYITSKRLLESFPAMLASIFFMSQLGFIWASYNPRTSTAVLFFALSMMVIFHPQIDKVARDILFIIFSYSCILTHYSTTYIFFLIIFFTWMVMQSRSIYAKLQSIKFADGCRNHLTDTEQNRRISSLMLLLFLTMIIFWYVVVTGGPFYSLKEFVLETYNSLPQFFSLESKGVGIAQAFGVGLDLKQVPQVMTVAFTWLTVIFLSVGVFSMIADQLGFKTLFSAKRPDPEFFILAIASFCILAASLALPYIGRAYGIDRLYIQMMVISSPFFVIGSTVIARCMHIRRSHLPLLIVLIPYLLCNTGTMHQIFGIDKVITLNSHGQMFEELYIHDQETYAARWIKEESEEWTDIYSDFLGTNRLTSQGSIQYPIYMEDLIVKHSAPDIGNIYLRYCGAVNGRLLDSNRIWHNITNYQMQLEKMKLIYDDGGSRCIRA